MRKSQRVPPRPAGTPSDLQRFGGAKGTRTPDPLPARQVLYQLSYGPETSKMLSHGVAAERSEGESTRGAADAGAPTGRDSV